MATRLIMPFAVLLLITAGCERLPKSSSMPTPISFVTASDLKKESKAVASRRSRRSGTYKTWKRLHDPLCVVALRYGRVSDSPDPTPDFYFSGDWFHQLTDGFALFTTRGLSAQALREFHQVVAAHHADAEVSLGGEVTTQLYGLDILITASCILVAWEGETPEGCKAKLMALGVRFD